MSIEYKKSITLTKDSTIYGHQGLDSAGFPKDAGNAKLSQVLDLSEGQTTESLKTRITITVDSANELLYHFNIDGDSVATFTVPSDRFLKSVSYDASTNMLIFTFVTKEGESTVSVDMSSLVDTYTAGDGLKLDNSVFSVNVKGSETRLKASADGLSIDLTDVIALIDTERTQRQNTYTDLDARIVIIENKTSAIDNAITTCNTKANEAASSASLASGYATTASEKATAASNSATQASNYRTDAWSYRDEAKGFSLMAERWASYPEDSLVYDSKYSALHYSEKAKGYMNTASSSATTASAKASEASTSANQAKGYRDEAQQIANQFNPASILLSVYPVGSYYLSDDSASPASLFGGTWEQIKDRFLVGAGGTYAINTTGGAATHTHTTGNHTLTLSEIPSHAHQTLVWHARNRNGYPNGSSDTGNGVGGSGNYNEGYWRGSNDYKEESTFRGGDSAHNHGSTGSANSLPLYKAIYIWRRKS